jgi:hypothetical protein
MSLSVKERTEVIPEADHKPLQDFVMNAHWPDDSLQRFQRMDDDCLIVIKSINVRDCADSRELENAVQKEMNLHHPCIAPPIGFIFPAESSRSQELKSAR